MTKRSKEFQVGPNLKPEPGSQGTLFRGNGPMKDDKWHRGYSPERQEEVLQKVAGSRGGGRDWRTRGSGGTRPYYRNMVETIARSTVPAEHLNGVQFSPGQESIRGGGAGDQVAGVYHRWGINTPDQIRKRKEEGKISPHISILKGEETSSTPIHEIGHHVSAEMGTGHSAYNTEELRGTEEGFADKYAQQHFRDRRRNPTQVGTYAGHTFNNSRGEAFYNGYFSARPERNVSTMRTKEESNPEHYMHFEKHGWFQPPLISKSYSDYDGTSGEYKSARLSQPEWSRMAKFPDVTRS